jgi:beta-lactamase regulating signal transducer with metallopeptidase domain
MHILLGLSSLLLVVLSSALALWSLRAHDGWGRRRELQLIVLASPLVGLGVSLGALYHFSGQVCFQDAPAWDYFVGLGLPLLLAIVALAGLGLGLVRLALMLWLVARSGLPADAELQACADRLAARLGVPTVPILLRPLDSPLALNLGLIRPRVLLSTWMIEHLDMRELEAVLAHELGHTAQRDYPLIWLATVLRDAFFYLPTSWAAHRRLKREKELACDELAVATTRRPLALASALVKVWQPSLAGLTLAQPLVETDSSVETRIQRLMSRPQAGATWTRPRVWGLAVAMAGLLIVQAANLAVMLAPMGCGPARAAGLL